MPVHDVEFTAMLKYSFSKRFAMKRPFWVKFVRIVLCFLLAVILIAGGILLSIYLRSRTYFANSEKAFLYPELDEGFIAQGIVYDEDEDVLFICGYKKKGVPSPIYVIDRMTGGLMASASMYKQDGTPFTGHSGGITVWKDLVFVAGTYDGLYVFSRDDVMNARNGEKITALGLFPLNIGGEKLTASFVSVHDDILTVGEFQMIFFADTEKSHHFKTPSGEKQYAVAVNYRLEESQPLGIVPQAVSAYSIPTLAQGICFHDGKILLSASVGFLMSKIYVYDPTGLQTCGTFGGVPVYALDKSVQTAKWTFPPMAEEIEIVDGYIYTMDEAASSKYQLGKLFDGQWCFKTKINTGVFDLEN